MFATPVCMSVMMVAAVGDPLTAVQLRYPNTRTTITTSTGVFVYYTLPADAPAELRRAYKALEASEREVFLTERSELLEQEYVQNERRLEALRTARTATYLAFTLYGTSGPLFYSSALLSPPESSVKWAVVGGLAQGTTVNRALAALDRMASAQYQLQQVYLNLAYPDRNNKPSTLQVSVPAPPAVGRRAEGAVGMTTDARDAEQAAAREEATAEEHERAARTKELAAEAKYRASLPDEREAARKTWLEARAQWEQARRDWDAARERWQTARDRVDALRPRNH